MKKDKEWLREEVYKLIEGYTSFGGHEHTFITGANVNKLGDLIDQLDEPEKEESVISNIAAFLTEYHYNCSVWGEKEVIHAIHKELTDYYGVKK